MPGRVNRNEFGKQGQVDLRTGVADAFPESTYAVTSPPAIYEDLVITGAEVPEGAALVLAVTSGPSTYAPASSSGNSIPCLSRVSRPHETWEGEGWRHRTGANVWPIMTVDVQRGLVFLPIGSPSYDFYGGDRKGQNLYGNCLVHWTHAPESYVGITRCSPRPVDYESARASGACYGQSGKAAKSPQSFRLRTMGLMFILHRETGQPLYTVREVPVPRSQVPGEESWPTQPIPVKPLRLSRSSLSSRGTEYSHA
jgi:quinoprotein glucose dehydrogenase